jgi:hypothetical protein
MYACLYMLVCACVCVQVSYFMVALGQRKGGRKWKGEKNSRGEVQQRAPMSVARGEVMAK